MNDFQCNCMEYWECIGQGGAPYAYCSYTHKVCCFLNSVDVKVGILPKKGKLTSCGQKGTDNGKDGVSEAGEWPWHVGGRNVFLFISYISPLFNKPPILCILYFEYHYLRIEVLALFNGRKFYLNKTKISI